MSFSIDDHDLPPLRCYSDAKLYWEKTKPWRGDSDTNTRPLAKRKRNQTIRQLNDGSFACRLHQTDVVTYHPNGDVSLQAYPSVSTDAFANRLTPHGVTTNFNSAAGYVVALSHPTDHTKDRFYKMEGVHNHLTIRRGENGWAPVDLSETTPFIKYRLDVTKKNAVFKQYDVAGFKAWFKARESLSDKNNQFGYYWLYNADHRDIAFRALNIEHWEGIYKEFGRHSLDAVRNAIYVVEKCITFDRLSHVEGWGVITSITKASRKYSHLSTKGN